MQNTCFVCMTVWNGEACLRDCVESVFAQEGVEVHLSVVDDGSRDGSAVLLKALSDRHSGRMSVQVSERNEGIGAALSKALRAYSGEAFFAMIGQDDAWEPGFLRSQTEALERSSALAAFSRVVPVDGNGAELAGHRRFIRFRHELLDKLDSQDLLLRLLEGNFLCAASSTVALSRLESENVLSDFFGFWNDSVQDYECWLNLCLRGRFIYNREAVVRYRMHGGNYSRGGKHWLQNQLEYYLMLDRVLNTPTLWTFLALQDTPEECAVNVIEAVWRKAEYSNPCRLLALRLCEEAAARRPDSHRLRHMLAAYYQDFGLLTKPYRLLGALPHGIPAAFTDRETERELSERVDVMTIFALKPSGTMGVIRIGALGGVETPDLALIPEAADREEQTSSAGLALKKEAFDAEHVLPFVEDARAEFRNGLLERYPLDNSQSAYLREIERSGATLDSRLFKVCRRLLNFIRSR